MPNHQLGITRLFSKSVDILQPNDIKNIITHMVTSGANTANETDRVKMINDSVVAIAPWKKLRDQFNDDSNIDFSQDNDVLKSNIKQYFLGGKARTVKTNDATLRMVDMYEFCYHNEKIVSNIEKDKDSFEKTCDTISNTIDAEAKKITDANTTKQDTSTEKTGEFHRNNSLDQKAAKESKEAKEAQQKLDQQNQQSKPVPHESAINMTGSYITEKLDINASGGSTSTNTSNTSGNRTTAVDASSSTNISNQAASDDDYKAVGSKVGNIVDKQTTSKENATAALNMVANILKSYRDECVCVLVSKMNAAREISSDYMDLIRAHVQSYIGQPNNTSDNVPVGNGTNYPKGNTPENGPANNK